MSPLLAPSIAYVVTEVWLSEERDWTLDSITLCNMI